MMPNQMMPMTLGGMRPPMLPFFQARSRMRPMMQRPVMPNQSMAMPVGGGNPLYAQKGRAGPELQVDFGGKGQGVSVGPGGQMVTPGAMNPGPMQRPLQMATDGTQAPSPGVGGMQRPQVLGQPMGGPGTAVGVPIEAQQASAQRRKTAFAVQGGGAYKTF